MHDQPHSDAPLPSRGAHAALWASAALILALIIAQIGRLSPFSAASAEVTQVAGLTVMTAFSGDGEQVLCVLDSRAERLLVYGVVNRNQIDLYQTVDVATLFADARAAGATGRPRR